MHTARVKRLTCLTRTWEVVWSTYVLYSATCRPHPARFYPLSARYGSD